MTFKITMNDALGNAVDPYMLYGEDVPFNITLEAVEILPDGDVVEKDLHYDLPKPQKREIDYDNDDDEEEEPSEEESNQLEVNYRVMSPGTYQLNIWLEGHPIYGSPFYPTVETGRTSARQCKVIGDGITKNFVNSLINE